MTPSPATPTQPADTGLRLANADPRYAHVALAEPSTSGFLHLAIQARANPRPGPVRGGDERLERTLATLTAFARDLGAHDAVRDATAFRAVLVAPAAGADAPVLPDAALLIETDTPADAVALHDAPELRWLLDGLEGDGVKTHAFAAHNARRIADVDHERDGGLFLFNHFIARDTDLAIALWDRLAAWYQRETKLTNSLLLAPAEDEDSAFAIVNHARWDTTLRRLFVEQFTKRTFFTYVRANLQANGVVAMPALYRLAT